MMINEPKQPRRLSFATLALLVLTLAGVGAVGYMAIEGWDFLDSIYMVVITLATVGFREVHPLSPAGMVFTMLLIIFGLFVLYYVVRLLGEYVLENKLEEALNNRKMERTLKQLSGHYIICGFGRVGRQVAYELMQEGGGLVIIEKNPALAEEAKVLGYPVIVGDSTEEDILKHAGILNAKTLVVALGSDSDSVLTIVTAKSLNNDLFIVARANGQHAASKLVKIGANRVVSPHQIGGFRMANFAVNPATADFLDDVQDLSNREIQISDVLVGNSSPVAGYSIAARLNNRNIGVTVLAIHKPDGNAIINPVGDTLIEAGDRLILLGTKDKLTPVIDMIGARERSRE
jgi:voltage-gated potassium channel